MKLIVIKYELWTCQMYPHVTCFKQQTTYLVHDKGMVGLMWSGKWSTRWDIIRCDYMSWAVQNIAWTAEQKKNMARTKCQVCFTSWEIQIRKECDKLNMTNINLFYFAWGVDCFKMIFNFKAWTQTLASLGGKTVTKYWETSSDHNSCNPWITLRLIWLSFH